VTDALAAIVELRKSMGHGNARGDQPPLLAGEIETMTTNVHTAVAAIGLVAVLTGCGSAYSGLTGSSGLGSDQYRPAVVVEPGNEARYEQVLAVCRQVAANRQATAAQKAQLETLTGVVEGAGVGAAAGAAYGGLLGSGGFDTGVGEGAAVGAAAGALGGLVTAFAGGANTTADETRRILLNCLRETSKGGTLWQVVE